MKRSIARWLLWLVGMVAVLALGCGLWLRHVWSGSQPDRTGALEIPGLSAPVEITWDERGIPTITARSFADACLAQGFVHAIDRPLQLELRRRAVRGRLSELAGEVTLGIDEESLRLGYHRVARQEAARLSPQTAEAARAYLAGIAAGLEQVRRNPPPDCRVAGCTLEPWELADVLALGRMFAGELSNAASDERARTEQLLALDPALLEQIYPIVNGDPLPPIPPATRALVAAARVSQPDADGPKAGQPEGAPDSQPMRPRSGLLFREQISAEASNAWAVSAARSSTGSALFVGDPHLGYELPAIWYEVRLAWPGGEVSGASLAGVPGVVIGHTRALAWSFTAACFDDADLFLVEVDDPVVPTRYREGDRWLPFTSEQAAIAVRSKPATSLRIARAGPAIYSGPSPFAGYGYLLRWAALENDGLADAIIQLAAASSVAEGIEAVRRIPGPGLNFLAADAAGSIAHTLVGRSPRRLGEGWDGLIAPVWTGTAMWDGFVPDDRMPTEIDPPEGVVVSANEAGLAAAPRQGNQVALRGDYFPSWRADRIRELLGSGDRLDTDTMQRYLADTQSLPARQLQSLAAACGLQSPAAREYIDWSGRVEAHGALLHAALLDALPRVGRERTRLGQLALDTLGYSTTWLQVLKTAQGDRSVEPWLDDPKTTPVETACTLLGAALDGASDALGAARDDRWEDHHVLALTSPVGIGPLARWFNPAPLPIPGDRDTVFVTSYRRTREPYRGQLLRAVHGSSYRMIVTWDDAGQPRSRSILPAGQSGHPASRHAFDQLPDYARTALRPLSPAPAPTGEPMRLLPPS